jgi:hypothetical protein
MWTSHAVKVSRCAVGWVVFAAGERGVWVVLPGLRVVVQAAGELVEQGAWGGGAVVAG